MEKLATRKDSLYIHFPFLYLFLHFFHNKKKGTQLLDEMSSSGSSFPLLVDDDATALLSLLPVGFGFFFDSDEGERCPLGQRREIRHE